MSHRTDYDAVAPRYDAQPFRAKDPDPHLRSFLVEKKVGARILDISCGTGNQLAANLTLSGVRSATGLDASMGMLTVARTKNLRGAGLVQASGDTLPFRANAFDFVSHQYAFHHVPDQAALVREVFRVLSPGGRFVLSNIAPRGMQDAAIYRYFPEALEQDLRDFPADDAIVEMFRAAGFVNLKHTSDRREASPPLSSIAKELKDKSSCSELTLLSDEAFARGVAQIDADLAALGPDAAVKTCWCLLAVVGDKA